MPFIGKQPQAGAYSKLDAITTSATATYNLTLDSGAYYPQSANHLLVSLNGVIQAPQDSFTVSGSQIIFDSALTSADVIDFIIALGDTLDIGVPSAGSVNTSQLANGAVTSAKLDTNIAVAGNITASNAMFAPSISGSSDTNTSLSFPGSDVAQLNNAGNARYKFHNLNGTSLFEVQASSTGGSGAGGAFLKFKGSNGTPVDIASIDGSMTNGSIGSESGILSFFTTDSGTNSEKVRIFSNGSMAVPNGISLGNGISAAASNLLDDYEEGNWTPTFGGSGTYGTGTYSTTVGRYVKVGKKVNCWGIIVSSGTHNGTGTLQIHGLPFTKENTYLSWGTETNLAYYISFTSYGSSTNDIRLLGPVSNGTYLRFHSFANTGDTSVPPTPANVQNGTAVYFSATYEVQ